MRSARRPLAIVIARGSDGTGVRDLPRPAAELVRHGIGDAAQIIDLDYPAGVRITSLRWPG